MLKIGILANKIILSATSDHLTKASLAEQVRRLQICIWHLLKPAVSAKLNSL